MNTLYTTSLRSSTPTVGFTRNIHSPNIHWRIIREQRELPSTAESVCLRRGRWMSWDKGDGGFKWKQTAGLCGVNKLAWQSAVQFSGSSEGSPTGLLAQSAVVWFKGSLAANTTITKYVCTYRKLHHVTYTFLLKAVTFHSYLPRSTTQVIRLNMILHGYTFNTIFNLQKKESKTLQLRCIACKCSFYRYPFF